MRAKRPQTLPVVIPKESCVDVIGRMDPPYRLMTELLYGCGLRLSECTNMRVHDIDTKELKVTVRNGKGAKDRVVPLPESIVGQVEMQKRYAEKIREKDERKEGCAGVFIPVSVEHTNRLAAHDSGWYWLFPAPELTSLPDSDQVKRYHIHETALQRAVRTATLEAGITLKVTPHTFRHCFATHHIENGTDLRQVQILMGHADIRTTMIYTRLVHQEQKLARSPLDIAREERTAEKNKR